MSNATAAPQVADPFENWWDTFKPTGNPTANAGPHIGDEPKMFETYGDDLALVNEAFDVNPATVWTMVDSDGKLWITPGFHFVNRMGYFITEVAFQDDQQDIPVDDDDEETEDEA